MSALSIYKYPFHLVDLLMVNMPAGAEILCVQTQREKPCMWARVDPSAPMELRSFAIYGTGHPISPDAAKDHRYVGTFQLAGGDLVFHVFEIERGLA